jgi:glucosyl-3-phosphoglycerate synthase
VTPEAARWFAERTWRVGDWSLPELVELKARREIRVSVVIPARDEEPTIGQVVTVLRSALVGDLVDELVVMDSDSTDATARVAAEAGAVVHAVSSVRPDLGWQPGKGEAVWKSLFVTSGDLLVFVDADLTLFGPHFVTGLLGPMLAVPEVALVKGFYDRILDDGDRPSTQGGRVTELVARPLLNVWWPDLAAVVQPLAGEWAARRSLMEALEVPSGYGVELASLLDTFTTAGLDAIAQVDLGARAHRHQHVHDLGVMAAELLVVADRRRRRAEGLPVGEPGRATLSHYLRTPGGAGDEAGGQWRSREVPLVERPPAVLARTGSVRTGSVRTGSGSAGARPC